MKEFLTNMKMPESLMDDVVQKGREFYYDPLNLHKEFSTWSSVGEFMGERKAKFSPSPALINKMSIHGERVIVDKKGAWLFLCGRDIFGNSVLDGKPQRGKPVFVFNQTGENLGYGVWLESKLLKTDEPIISNKIDKGLYLRREK